MYHERIGLRDNAMTVDYQGRSFSVVKSVGQANFEGFWDYFARGLWEPETLRMIDRIGDETTIFLDVGGWIGPTALWAAFNGKSVITFEPDPVALKALRANLELNPQLASSISVVSSAVGLGYGDLELFAARPGMSETSVFRTVQRKDAVEHFGSQICVPTVDFAQVIRDLNPNENKIFIKMDIEGAEFDVLPHIADIVAKYDVTVSVTLHAPNIVEDTPDATMACRILKIAKCLEPFRHLKWFKFEDDVFREVEKFPFLIDVLNDVNHDANVIISRSSLSMQSPDAPAGAP